MRSKTPKALGLKTRRRGVHVPVVARQIVPARWQSCSARGFVGTIPERAQSRWVLPSGKRPVCQLGRHIPTALRIGAHRPFRSSSTARQHRPWRRPAHAYGRVGADLSITGVAERAALAFLGLIAFKRPAFIADVVAGRLHERLNWSLVTSNRPTANLCLIITLCCGPSLPAAAPASISSLLDPINSSPVGTGTT